MDKASEKLAVKDDPQQPEEATARLLELLLCEQQQRDELALLLSRDEARLQMAEPPEPAQELHMGEVPAALDGGLEDPRTQNRRTADERGGRDPGDETCLKQEDC